MTERITGWQAGQIVGIETLTPRIKRFLVLPSTPFNHRPGQHVDLRLTADDGYQAMRSYSIASALSADGVLELAIELLDDGEVSPFFHDVVVVGDEIELRGPLGGHFVWSPVDGGPLLLVGGGSGVAPLMAMIREREQEGAAVSVALLLSARTLADAPYLEELKAAEDRANGFVFRLATTREPPLRGLDYGRRIDAAMMAEVIGLLPAAPTQVYVCGSNAFANAAADSALAAGVAVERIRTERYGG